MKNKYFKIRTRLSDVKGLTMVEVLAVLVVIGVLAFVAVSKSGLSIDAAVTAESEALKNQLRFAQNRSMNTKDAWGITSASSSYRLFRYDPDNGTTTYVALPGSGANAENLGAKGLSVSAFTISFDNWGRPCSGATGATAHTSNQTAYVSKGGKSRTITITKNTGFIP